ncbi:MAG TPA: amidohydrolase family protein [Candidatus Saccharimonadales bacterium]|nr:amidohydrolase family protein [Candidatus Saccharimonadales bacterium]
MTRVKTRTVVILVAIALMAQLRPALAENGTLVISNATLIDGTGAKERPKVTILVRDGLIVRVVDAGEAVIPDGTHIVDATGKFVIPGLANMHVHYGTGGLVPFDSHTVDRTLRQFLFYGVTTIFNLGATGGSLEDVLHLRALQREGRLVGPHIYATGGLLTVPGSHPIATIMHLPEGADAKTYDWSKRGVWVVRTPEDVRRIVERLAAAGMDGIKIVIESGPGIFGDNHPQMPPALVAASVDEATRHGLSVFAHATSIDELEEALASHVRGVMHIVDDPGPPSDKLLEVMAEQGTYYVPTLSAFIWTSTWGPPSQVLTDPFLKSGVEARVIKSLVESPLAPTGPPSDKEWAWRRGMLQALEKAHAAGVRIAGGSDTANPFVFPGYSMHEELALMVEAGLTPMEALVSATRRAAEMLHAEDTFGTVEPGKRADLLILGSDPLKDIRNTRTLEAVIQNGRIIDRSSLLAHD